MMVAIIDRLIHHSLPIDLRWTELPHEAVGNSVKHFPPVPGENLRKTGEFPLAKNICLQ
ncbi:MAG: hypothetical protein WBJ85_04420 [Acetomicrobium sp.]